jgi:hypothetical protein
MSNFLPVLYKAVRRNQFDSKMVNFIPATSVLHGFIVLEPSAYMNSSGATPRIFDKQLKASTVRDRQSTSVNERSIMLVKTTNNNVKNLQFKHRVKDDDTSLASAVAPRVRCSAGPLFRGSAIPRVRYSARPLFRGSAIPRVRYSAGPLFRRCET